MSSLPLRTAISAMSKKGSRNSTVVPSVLQSPVRSAVWSESQFSLAKK